MEGATRQEHGGLGAGAGQPGVCLANSTARQEGTFQKQRSLDSSSDAASSLTHSGFGQLTTFLHLSILLSECA